MTRTQWRIKGSIIGACSCDWGCPCSFNAPPTYGRCEGGYTWHIDDGKFGDVELDGLNMSWIAQSPGPMHEGHVNAHRYSGGSEQDHSGKYAELAPIEYGGP